MPPGSRQVPKVRKGKSWIFNRGGLGQEVLCVSREGLTAMTTTENNKGGSASHVADLYSLAFLLTERQDLSIEIASDTAVSGDYETAFFTGWMRGWQRRLVIGRALTAIHDELAGSARRTQLAHVTRSARDSAAPPSNWSLSPDTTKADLDQALLAIDLFPRSALLLLVFEGIRMADAATLLDADPALIRKAQAIGLRELTANLARNSPDGQRGNKPVTANSRQETPKKRCSWLQATAVCH
jgi:DNA-directed RNA polymerase specialized sigma24 family protein